MFCNVSLGSRSSKLTGMYRTIEYPEFLKDSTRTIEPVYHRYIAG